MAKARDFDVAEYLDSPEAIAAYLSEAFETGDDSLIAQALGAVARLKGMKAVAEETGLNRENLYRALSEGGRPELGTVMKVLDALDVRARRKTQRREPKGRLATPRKPKGEAQAPAPPLPTSRRWPTRSRSKPRICRAKQAASWRTCKRRGAHPSTARGPSPRRSGYGRAGGRGRRAQSASRVRAPLILFARHDRSNCLSLPGLTRQSMRPARSRER